MKVGAWSAEEIEFLKEHWPAGWDDPQIAEKLDRSIKSVQTKRSHLGFTEFHYPNRPNLFGTARGRGYGRTYTPEDDSDILRRIDAGEDIGDVAKEYGVSRSTMCSKVDRLLDRRMSKELPQPSPRRCLGCGRMFESKLPKSANRQCPNCVDSRQSMGSSFLVVY